MRAKAAKRNGWGKIRIVTPAEMRRRFELRARRDFKMSGDEFIRKWEAGEFGDLDDPYRPDLWDLARLVPFVKQNPCFK